MTLKMDKTEFLKQFAFFSVIEGGVIERRIRPMIASIRNASGDFANVPIYVVRARRGPVLEKSSLLFLERYQVTLINQPSSSNWSWYDFYNKAYASAIVCQNEQHSYLCWLDDDMLIISEPDKLVNAVDSFVACASDRNIGTSAVGDRYWEYWKHFCKTVDVDFNIHA